MARFTRHGIGTLFIVLLAHAAAWAQATAQLSGTVRDSSGGVLPGVTVTVTQIDTGFTRNVVTENGGTYVVPNLPTGPYTLEASLQGFRSYVQTGIVLQVNGNPTINVTLPVGDVAETISVIGAAPLVDVRSAGISEVVDNQKIVELPLQGRQVTNLIFNLFNNFNWGIPVTNFDAGTFGRITSSAGDPRIMQFGVKYGF